MNVKTDVRKAVYISKEIAEALEKEAETKGTNISNLIRMILVERYSNQK